MIPERESIDSIKTAIFNYHFKGKNSKILTKARKTKIGRN